MSDERDDIVVLVDEDGSEIEFEYLDTIELNENEYVVLLPLGEDAENADVDEVVILKIEQGEEDEESFVSIDDDDELDAVFEEFRSRMEDEFGFED